MRPGICRQGRLKEGVDAAVDETLLDHDDGVDEIVFAPMECMFDVKRFLVPSYDFGGDGETVEEADGTAIAYSGCACRINVDEDISRTERQN